MKGPMKLAACLIPSFIAFAAFYLTPKAGASPVVPRDPSPSQAGCFTCPPTDRLGFALGEHHSEGATIFCSYPPFEGEDPNDYFCRYDSATGAVVFDYSAGSCTPATQQNCTRRRGVSPIQRIVARQNSERALRRAIAAVKKSMSHEEYILRREKKLERARSLIFDAR